MNVPGPLLSAPTAAALALWLSLLGALIVDRAQAHAKDCAQPCDRDSDCRIGYACLADGAASKCLPESCSRCDALSSCITLSLGGSECRFDHCKRP